jgi:anaerobic magnesium-protoporphyrin IX monomethyl ester cyclase
MRVLLVNPPLRSITNRVGVGFQLPLGLVMVGGPLVDAGHQVTLCDADALGLSPREVAATAVRAQSSVVLVGHSGSTAANPISIDVMAAVKAALPSATTVYGGVYPTYAADVLLERYSEIDVIARGEGEATVAELVSLIASGDRDFRLGACPRIELNGVGREWKHRRWPGVGGKAGVMHGERPD